MAEWKTVLLGNISKTNTSSYSNKEEWKFVNYLDTGNITVNDIGEIQYIDLNEEKLPSRAKRKVKFNSIIYSTVRPNQLHYGIIKEQPENFLVSTGFTVIDVDETVADANFIYYWLTKSTLTEQLQSIAEQSVSTYPSIKSSDLEGLEIELPPLDVQKKIADILSSLDNKRKTNASINRNLSEQAQALYKSWFVDLNPFEGERPADWQDGTVDDLASEVVCGKTPSTKKEEYYGNDIPFVTIPDMHGCVYTIHTERSLSELGAESQSKKTLPKNSICVSCIGTAGLVTLLPVPSQTNQQINSIIPKDNYSPYYIYLLMSTMRETINKLGQAGSTIVNLNKTQFGKIEVLIPSIKTMSDFDEIVEPVFSAILSNQIENEKLANLRDSLLPKLMSGEIDVSDLEI